MGGVDLIMGLCALVAVGGGVMAAFHPNILSAAIGLIFSLLGVAGLYGILGAEFLAATQLMVYVGGILIVILFAIMMSTDLYRPRLLRELRANAAVLLLSVALGALMLRVLTLGEEWKLAGHERGSVTVEALGRALIGPYAFALELSGLVLLAGLVGAVVVARPRAFRNLSDAERRDAEGDTP